MWAETRIDFKDSLEELFQNWVPPKKNFFRDKGLFILMKTQTPFTPRFCKRNNVS